MYVVTPGRPRRGRRLALAIALVAASAFAAPASARAGVIVVAIANYVASVGIPRADYFNGVLLTEHDLDQEQSYMLSAKRYIRETEADLDLLLAQAGDGSVDLLLDEADPLIDKRTDVMDSHDRYADDFIVLNPDGSWIGQLYLDQSGDRPAGVYADLSGTYRNLAVVAEPAPIIPMMLAMTVLALRRRSLRAQ